MTNDSPTITVLFADVCDSTSLYESKGDHHAFALISARIAELIAILESSGGRIVKTIGDGIMAVFPDAATAVSASNRCQQFEGLQVSIGIHLGPVIERDGDVFGDVVNVAARLQGLASPSETLLSREVHQGLPPLLQKETQALDRASVKGKRAQIDLYRIVIQPGEMTREGARSGDWSKQDRVTGRWLKLVHLGQEFLLTPDAPKFVIGRDPGCDLHVMDSDVVSRRHASITTRGGLFYLQDQSSNGTFVGRGGDELIELRRADVQLLGEGVIALGEPPVWGAPGTVAYLAAVAPADDPGGDVD